MTQQIAHRCAHSAILDDRYTWSRWCVRIACRRSGYDNSMSVTLLWMRLMLSLSPTLSCKLGRMLRYNIVSSAVAPHISCIMHTSYLCYMLGYCWLSEYQRAPNFIIVSRAWNLIHRANTRAELNMHRINHGGTAVRILFVTWRPSVGDEQTKPCGIHAKYGHFLESSAPGQN